MRSTLGRLSSRQVRLGFAGALGALAVIGLAGPAAFAGVSLSKPVVDTTAGPAVAGSPTTFKATAKFSPPSMDHEQGEDPWVQFKWNFGDGTIQNGAYSATGKAVESIQHTYASPGTYTVICQAGHGQTFFGFKYYASKTIQVTVACPGTDLGSKCPNGTFDAFSGVWTVVPSGSTFPPGSTLGLSQIGDKVVGTVNYQGDTGPVVIPIKGTPKYTALMNSGGEKLETFQFDGKAKVGGAKVGYHMGMNVTTTDGLVNNGGRVAYRAIALSLDDPPDAGGLASIGAYFSMSSRADDTATTLCMLLGGAASGGKVAKPGELVTFVVSIGASGPACIPAERVGLSVQLTGATTNEALVVTDRFASVAVTDTAVAGLLGAFGAGSGQKNARAKLVISATVDPDATHVDCLVHLTPQVAGPDAPFATVTVSPDRKMCIAVDQSGN